MLGGAPCLGDDVYSILGQCRSAHAFLRRGLALYDPQQHRTSAFRLWVDDAGVLCHVWTALGRCGTWVILIKRLARSHEAVTRWRRSCRTLLVWHHALSLCGDASISSAASVTLTQERRPKLRISTLPRHRDFPTRWRRECSFLRGWALAHQEQARKGSSKIPKACRPCVPRAQRYETVRIFLRCSLKHMGPSRQPETGLTVLRKR